MIPDPPFLAPRSGHWPAVRAAHLRKEPACLICGDGKTPDVHHVVPVHVDPARELDPTNLATLCRHDHWVWGHCCDWFSWAETFRSDVERYRTAVSRRPHSKTPLNLERSLTVADDYPDLTPYPDSLPGVTQTKVLADALRGNAPDPDLAIHIGWHVTGFAAGQVAAAKAGPPPEAAAAPRKSLTREQAAQLLESHAALRSGGAAAAPGAAAAVPWDVIVPLIVQVIGDLLRRRQGA